MTFMDLLSDMVKSTPAPKNVTEFKNENEGGGISFNTISRPTSMTLVDIGKSIKRREKQ